MELTYPRLIYIGIVILALSFIITVFHANKYKGGIKSGGGSYLKKLPYYRWLIVRYVIIKFIMVASLMAAIVVALYLASKPTEVRTITNETHNRDIFICLDVSTSLDEVNIELCDMMKDFVKKLKGERFGLSIFNAKSILVIPLTTDYKYVLQMIDKLEESIEAGKDVYYYSDIADYEAYGYRFSGTLSEAGSSLIGDGLATCLYDFPDLDEEPDRSRMIVFVTDNDLQGTPLCTIEDACAFCEARGVKVFALAPDFVVDEERFATAIESTGGGYFNTRDSKAMRKMMNEVEDTNVNVSYRSVISTVDVPEKGIMALVILMLVYSVCAWRIRQ